MLSRFPVAFRLHGVRFLVIPSPLGNWASLTVGLPAPVTRSGTPTGLSRFARMRYGRRGRPLNPGDSGARTTGAWYPVAACRFPTAKSLHPGPAPIIRGSTSRGIIKGSVSFARPAFPSPVTPGWSGTLGLLPRASHPAVTGSACRGGDRHWALARATSPPSDGPPIYVTAHHVRLRGAPSRRWQRSGSPSSRG